MRPAILAEPITPAPESLAFSRARCRGFNVGFAYGLGLMAASALVVVAAFCWAGLWLMGRA